MKDTHGPNTQESPARNSYAITPHDSNEIGTILPRALYVGTGGNIVMQLADDSADVTFVGVVAGTVLPVRPRIIKSTSTTASDMVAIY